MRARAGPDWLYTYLRTFYRDDSTATGWNNLVFPNVGMPHVLWELQGQQVLKVEERRAAHGKRARENARPGDARHADADEHTTRWSADLVNYLVFMGEPARQARMRIGYAVLFFLGVLFVPVYLLKKEYWKDVH